MRIPVTGSTWIAAQRSTMAGKAAATAIQQAEIDVAATLNNMVIG